VVRSRAGPFGNPQTRTARESRRYARDQRLILPTSAGFKSASTALCIDVPVAAIAPYGGSISDE
jgi:hypothetical protein